MVEAELHKVETLGTELSALVDYFSKEMRTVSEEVMATGRHQNVEELKGRIRTVQEEVYRDTLQKYGDLLGAAVEAERALVTQINRLKEFKERAGILKEVITSMVRPGVGE